MSSKEKRKENREIKRVDELKREIKENDLVLKKNHEKTKEQIQVGLYQKGYPQGNPMYDSYIDKMKLDLEDAQIRIDSGLKLINPTFEFQTDPRWVEIQKECIKRNIKAIKGNLEEVEKRVEEVKKDIVAQNQRINLRRIQIIEDLKKQGENVSEFIEKVPSYIG